MANVQLTDAHRAVLRALADTVVPSLDRPEDPTGFWRLSGSDLQADAVVGEGLLQLPEDQRAGVFALLDGLHVLGFATGSRRECEQLIRRRFADGRSAGRRNEQVDVTDAGGRLRGTRPADRVEPDVGWLRLPRGTRDRAGRRRGVPSRSSPMGPRRCSRPTWSSSARGPAAA